MENTSTRPVQPGKDNNGNVSLRFLGAAGTVTGSKHLLKTPGLNILIDCGLFQGLKPLRMLNREPLAESVENIDIVILTHAHLDHSGYLPVLVKQGFNGRMIMTPPTKDYTVIILNDSARLQEEDADTANKEGFSKHHPALPLYTEEDVKNTIGLFETLEDNVWMQLSADIRFRFLRNGHILGSCFIEMECFGKTIVFSGDIGRQDTPTLSEPLRPDKADFLIIESTYGNRLHPNVDPGDELKHIILDTFQKKGNLLISSFAIGRAQELMVLINKLKSSRQIPEIPVFLDTPMGTKATNVMMKYPEWHHLTEAECIDILENVEKVEKLNQTYEVIFSSGTKIIIAASGMLTGGRVLHYLKKYLKDPKNVILLVGYQAEGTRGRALKEGAHELKIHGNYYNVKAEIREMISLSAHADQSELLAWMGEIKSTPAKIFIVHGEPDAAYTFALKIRDTFGWETKIPSLNEEVTLFEVEKKK